MKQKCCCKDILCRFLKNKTKKLSVKWKSACFVSYLRSTKCFRRQRKCWMTSSVLCTSRMNTGKYCGWLEPLQEIANEQFFLEHDEFSRKSRLQFVPYWKMCAEIFGKETKRCFVRTSTSSLLLFEHGLSCVYIRKTTILYLWCWMLFDGFLFILFLCVCSGVRYFRLFLVSAYCLSARALHLFVWNVCFGFGFGCRFCGRSQLCVCVVVVFDTISSMKMWKPNKMNLISTFVRFQTECVCTFDCNGMRKTEKPISYFCARREEKKQMKYKSISNNRRDDFRFCGWRIKQIIWLKWHLF